MLFHLAAVGAATSVRENPRKWGKEALLLRKTGTGSCNGVFSFSRGVLVLVLVFGPLTHVAETQVEDPLREVYTEDGSSGKKKGRRGSALGGGDGGNGDDGPPPGTSMGFQHSRLEGRVVGAAWSSDPDECHFCKGEVRERLLARTGWIYCLRSGTVRFLSRQRWIHAGRVVFQQLVHYVPPLCKYVKFECFVS